MNSVPSRTEGQLSAGDVQSAAALLAEQAPGLLARQLRRLASLAVFSDRESSADGSSPGDSSPAGAVDVLLANLAGCAEQVPARVLWTVYAQILDNGATYPRLAFTKAGGALTVPGPVGHLALPGPVRLRLLAALAGALNKQSAAREKQSSIPMAGRTVWIDPALDVVLMPDQLRSTAAGLAQLERGSRLALGDAPVLRMFVHWKEHTGKDAATSDLDLSMLALDENFELVGQVSYTNLANGAMTHSGDLTSAPDGAQEFIDVRLDDARAMPGWRYLVPAVYRYAGPAFADLPEAHVGWMLRHECSTARATFDPAAVVNAFALSGRGAQALPILVDLNEQQVVYVDVYSGSGFRTSVETAGVATAALVAAAATRARTRMSIAHVAGSAVQARGGRLVPERAGADITFGLDEACTFDVRSPQGMLGELL